MITKNNPFSKDISSKKMFDWTFAMTAEQQVIFSLQRYKELFWYFINCFRVGKIEMLEKDLFDETWDSNYNDSVGCSVFHLAVNCYLYYIGYRENENCVELLQKKLAQDLLQKIIVKNSTYFRYLHIENVKERYLQLFLQGVELMPKKESGKLMILPDVVRDFYVFSLLLVCCYKTFNLRDILNQNEDLYTYRKFLSDEIENKEAFSVFLSLFCTDKTIQIDDLYSVLINTLQSIFKIKKIQESKQYLEKYKNHFSEKEYGEAFKKQIQEFITRIFMPVSAKDGKSLKLQKKQLLSSRYLTNFVEQDIDHMSLDILLFNLLMQIIKELRIHNYLVLLRNFNKKDTQKYLDFLTEHSLDFVIGSHDVIAPQDYKEYELFERFKRDFKHIYTLGLFRNILALNSKVISLYIDNYQISFSVPKIDEMKDEYEKDKDGTFRKKGEVERFTEEELLEIIENTYRNITVIADISICLNADKVGYFIIPTK